LRHFLRYLQEHGYYVDSSAAHDAFQERSMFTVLDSEPEWKIDFLFSKPRPLSQIEFLRRKPIAFGESSLFVTTAEDLILATLGKDARAASAG
jgi:hypothetical protein